MELNSPISDIKGVGESLSKKLNIIGVRTVEDLINYYPRRYDDYSTITPIAGIKPGPVSIKAEIKQARGRYVRRGMHITEAIASDKTGSVRLVWFNQPYRAVSLKAGQAYYISGNFEFNYRRLSIMNPSVELASDFPVNTARIVPVYKETGGLKSAQLRRILKEITPILDDLPETLPKWVINANKLIKYNKALREMHFPSSAKDLEEAKKRLGFEEVFQLLLASLLNKNENSRLKALKIPFKLELARTFVGHLPFKLTPDQRRAVWSIYQDMESPSPMNRLIEGDVGSGKTVVAGMAALMAMEQGWQVAYMAPTELLARQHAETLYKLFKPLGFEAQVGLLVGGLSAKQKGQAHKDIESGQIRLIVGTHALIQEQVNMHKLGLIIIDEQHRFGVEQRKTLQKKAGHMPHVLSMTATPIPRSLALTLYGELNVTLIKSSPAKRKPTKTQLIPPSSRSSIYKVLETELIAGRQAFVVCPLIFEKENNGRGRSAEAVFKELKLALPRRNIGLLHGKMKANEKNKMMEDFIAKKIDILVSTTVIEVGVDVPNASVMLIENPERFGLAQIHQLRGRVGRGGHQGYCYLMLSDSKSPSARLKAIAGSSDGFELAELDLEIRGPGAIYGTLQHGQLDLRIAKLTDARLIASAQKSAKEFIDRKENLLKYKQLSERVQHLRAVTNLN